MIYHMTNWTPLEDMPRQLVISSLGFKYLGIFVTSYENLSLAKNLKHIISEFQENISRWLKLPLTIMGRAAMFKMIMLPKLLYILQNTYY